MRFSTLDEWLHWQERLHLRSIELGLERVSAVWRRLGASLEGITVISVAGTNGKGSTIAFLEAILGAGGYSIGSYTSPHLHHYNERIRLGGRPVDDETIMAAFDAIDRARGDLPLTYFEFGTLAALWIMARQPVEVALLEVGLGGRLDAVNLVDADLALVTSVDLDHQAWLGDDREAIGREKAGIFRPGRPAVFSSPEMPASVAEVAEGLDTPLFRGGVDFHYQREGEQWHWQGRASRHSALPLPALPGRHQLDNAAGVLMALELLDERLPVTDAAIRQGLVLASLPGRMQRIEKEGVTWLLDVAHNPHAARALADALSAFPSHGRRYALLGMLEDKDVAGITEPLAPLVDQWHLAGLAVERGRSAAELARYICGEQHATVAGAVAALLEKTSPGDQVVVLGSFHTVGEALSLLGSRKTDRQEGLPRDH